MSNNYCFIQIFATTNVAIIMSNTQICRFGGRFDPADEALQMRSYLSREMSSTCHFAQKSSSKVGFGMGVRGWMWYGVVRLEDSLQDFLWDYEIYGITMSSQISMLQDVGICFGIMRSLWDFMTSPYFNVAGLLVGFLKGLWDFFGISWAHHISILQDCLWDFLWDWEIFSGFHDLTIFQCCRTAYGISPDRNLRDRQVIFFSSLWVCKKIRDAKRDE